MALLDTIKANLANTATPSQVGGIADTTSQIGQLQQAKTGKAGGAPMTARSTNLQEQIASGQAALGAAEVQQQAKLQSEQLSQAEKAQTESQGLADRQLDEVALQQHDTFANQSARILQELTQSGRTLDFKRDAAKVEQLGIASRLANDKYVNQLEQEGQRSRLDTQIGFDEAIQNTVWGDDKDLLDSDMEFRQMLGAKNNEWNEYMNSMSMDAVLEAAEKEQKGANQRMIWGALGAGGSAVAGGMMGGGSSGQAAAPAAEGGMSSGKATSNNVLIDSELGGR